MKNTYVISDLHLGGENDPKDSRNVETFLNELHNSYNDQLVILGDFLDRWALPITESPRSYGDMLNDDNINAVIQALNNCFNKGISIYFMNGNHDFDLTQDDLPPFIQHIDPESFYYLKNNELYMEHGNSFDLFNANGMSDDGKIEFPLGYFKTRLNSTNKLAPMQTDLNVMHVKEEIISELSKHAQKNTSMSREEFSNLLSSYSTRFLNALANDVTLRFPGENIKSININMPQGYSVAQLNLVKDIIPNYKGFVERYYYNVLLPLLFSNKLKPGEIIDIPIQWEALMNAIDPIRTDGLKWYANFLAKKESNIETLKGIVFGHTHMCQTFNLGEENENNLDLPTYANTGCWCINPVGPNTTSIRYTAKTITLHSNDIGVANYKYEMA